MSLNSEEYMNLVTDIMSEGLIVIDNEGKIQIYNRKAKEIFGILNNNKQYHSKGKIQVGDIVIIADNALGMDDGELNAKKLEYIGIYDKNIKKKGALIAIGVYKDNRVEPMYKYLECNNLEDTLSLEAVYLDLKIRVTIEFINKIIAIEVGEDKYTMRYFNSIGHMVLVDSKSKKVKFYQSNGYTVRKESISDILMGKEYRAKGDGSDILDVIGKDIFEIHRDDPSIIDFYKAAKGADICYKDEFKEINGFPTMCSLIPLDKGGKRIGAALKVEDVSEIRKVITERDKALLKLEKMEKEFQVERELKKSFPHIVSESKKMKNVIRLAFRASKTNSTVLILGESGTGKTILAKAIHENSKINNKTFIHVNCGAIPANLLESELFGYEKGAFTGASNLGKMGLFEIADGGTMFLDEIGDLPMSLQVKLLQVLQEKCFYRVGGTGKVYVNVRIIVATNKNLEEEMLAGRFREDLYYRISVFPIFIPPLRERIEDIYPLVEQLLPKICKKVGTENKRISAEALNSLIKYSWPGNVRELENILERAVILSEKNTILSKHIAFQKEQRRTQSKGIIPLKEEIEQCEKEAIKRALVHYNGNKKEAMKALGMCKTSFYEKIKRYGLV